MIEQLRLHDFRNYTEKTFQFTEKNVVFLGANGKGKTNILEALSLLSIGKSWRTHSTMNLIREGAESACIEARNENTYRVVLTPHSRTFYRHQKKQPLKQYFGQIPSLLFAPEHLHLFSAAKKDRQQFFDRFLFQISPSYRKNITHCHRAIQQKNALLKSMDIPGSNSRNPKLMVQPWNEILAQTIPLIINERNEFLRKINPLIEKEFQLLAQSVEPLRITLQIEEDFETTIEGVRDFFQKNTPREIVARRTLIGPHRDDFLFFLREKPITSTASRGEERSVLLALLASQKILLQKKISLHPIVLLDDVFSELDQSRQNYLESLCDGSQIFFTTTHASHCANFSRPVQKIIQFEL
jgi:DNA replication and repair protein RecF